jgi:hypothetical protein
MLVEKLAQHLHGMVDEGSRVKEEFDSVALVGFIM